MKTVVDMREQQEHPLRVSLAAQLPLWPEGPADLGCLEDGWTVVADFFADDAAIDDLMAYEGSMNAGTDEKTCAAFLMSDYCYAFSIATVPSFVAHGLVADMSISAMALSFHVHAHEHDGEIMDRRRAHMRFLSPSFHTDHPEHQGHANALPVLDRDGLCEIYRLALEQHFHPLVELLSARSGLSKNALWRLVADAIAGRFLDAGRRFGVIEDAKADAMKILKHQGSPLANKQLHYFDLSVLDRQQREFSYDFRARGGCCRYYLVEGGEYCSTCVLKDPKSRDADLMAEMRHHLGVSAEQGA